MPTIPPIALSLLAAYATAAVPGEGTVTDGRLRLVESFPIETTLDAPDLPQTADVWLEMVRGARTEILLSHFYASTAEGSALEDVIGALEAAGRRGVAVRFLLAERFRATYPEVPARLDRAEGVEVRFVDFDKVAGGVMHAKYMVVDARRSFLGSPNFDFRSLKHIQELGVDLEDPVIARGLRRVFAMDWALAGGEELELAPPAVAKTTVPLIPAQAGEHDAVTSVTLACSPRDHLPPGVPWDLPLIVDLIDGAETSLRAQVLTYDATGYDRSYFPDLENALRRAAARGVSVELLVADWCKRKHTVDGLQSLACLEGIEVRFVVIPDWSEGFIPFSRVAHPKFCVADERSAWIGTSNWEGSYFTASRNVGLVVDGPAVAARLARWFDVTFDGPYAERVVPGSTYTPRRRDR